MYLKEESVAYSGQRKKVESIFSFNRKLFQLRKLASKEIVQMIGLEN